MRILAISDEVSHALYHNNVYDQVGQVDLLVGCGDLPYGYMEFIVTQTRARHAYYVHGNHDKPSRFRSSRVLTDPGGWQDIDRQTVYLPEHGAMVAGLEGCHRYDPYGGYQYTEAQMRLRAMSLMVKLFVQRSLRGRQLDILIAHAPAYGIHDAPGTAHRGFHALLMLLDRFSPRLFLHGHHHRYGRSKWHTRHGDTDVVNVHPFCMITMEGPNIKIDRFRRH
jgi:Icc-related predicted phosphoesterase